MTYMLLIHEPVGQRATRTEAEGRAAYAAMVAFGERLAAQGQLKAVESLAGLESAVRVSHAGGRAQTLDGPFAEAKEMVGGFFLLQNVTACSGHRAGPRMPGRAVVHGRGAGAGTLFRREQGLIRVFPGVGPVESAQAASSCG
jgi:hypothetical protein